MNTLFKNRSLNLLRFRKNESTNNTVIIRNVRKSYDTTISLYRREKCTEETDKVNNRLLGVMKYS